MHFSRILFFLCGLFFANSTFSTTVLPVSLEHMSKTAEFVFHGKVISNEVKLDDVSNRVATYTVFEIIDNVKGNTGITHTVKQIGGQLPGSTVVHKFHGVPSFTVGEEYVVFLPKESRLGFASPIGLGQGKFSVLKHNGITTVSNGRAISNLVTSAQTNRNLSSAELQARATKPSYALPSIPDQPTKTRLTDFIKTVRDLSKE